MWHDILLTFDTQRLSARFHQYPSAWSESINRFKMATIVRFELDVSEKGPFLDKTSVLVQMICKYTDKCISANDMQIYQQKGDMPTIICNNIHAEQA